MIIRSESYLDAIKANVEAEEGRYKYKVLVCMGAGCISSGSEPVRDALVEEIERLGMSGRVKVVGTGCIGCCGSGPVVLVQPDGVLYQGLKPEDARGIVEEHILNGVFIERLLYRSPESGNVIPLMRDIPFFKHQTKNLLRICGNIDPTRIEEYIALEGYYALSKVLTSMTPEDVVEEIRSSRLRGRGGAGFPTGLKWNFTRIAKDEPKYVVANADEGDPGAFMDRCLLEGDPHSLIEGMTIAGYAVGAHKGYIYIRAEYPLAVSRLSQAIEQARKLGLLGGDIMESGFSFDIELRMGAGAFVCGEETALLASIEGRRGVPRPRPPFPAEKGVWGKPTALNNVETLANVPMIIRNGAECYRSLGTERSGGTKMYSLAGDIENTGLIEVPIGTEMGKIIYDIGDGCKGGKKFKAVQSGGPSGGCIPREHLNVKVDYETLDQLGAIMGSGGLVVMNEDTCMVDIARYFLEFCLSESCGKCTPCREGFQRMLEILERITRGEGREGDIERLEDLSHVIVDTALCGLGRTGPNPVLSTIKHFKDEYEAHIKHKKCPAGVCEALFESPCQNACPAGLDTHGYVALISEGRFGEALELIMERNPFPSVCGRICTNPCELKCRRGETDDPIAIRLLKRFVSDLEKPSLLLHQVNQKGGRVAIVGSGPTGLTAAYHLTRMGHRTTIFEALPKVGGMMTICIPEYRLPKGVLEAEIDVIRDLGVEIRTNKKMGEDFTLDDLFGQGYAAVYLSVGAQKSRSMGIPGEELGGVYQGIGFLKGLNLGDEVKLGDKVAVIGGGDVAIDSARSAVRLGAREVTLFYRRGREDMTATDEEVAEAIEEGVRFHYMTLPTRIFGDNGKATWMECIRMEGGEFDTSGRRRPVPVEGTGFVVDVDSVIIAIGQTTDLSFLNPENRLEISSSGTLLVDPDTLQTSDERVFAGGDLVRGPSTVIEAISDGIKASMAIDKFLGGRGEIVETVRREARIGDIPFDLEAEFVEQRRVEAPVLRPDERYRNFMEIELGYAAENAMEEARRCLHCDRKLEE